jgi:hypothetical protein
LFSAQSNLKREQGGNPSKSTNRFIYNLEFITEALDEESLLLRRIAIFAAPCVVQQFVLDYWWLQSSHANSRIGIFRQFRHAAAIAQSAD